jgi:hypothetical protein
MFFFRQFPNLGYGLALIITKRTIPQSLHMIEFCVKLNFNAREPNWRGFRNACDSACRREISDQLKIYSVAVTPWTPWFKKTFELLEGKVSSQLVVKMFKGNVCVRREERTSHFNRKRRANWFSLEFLIFFVLFLEMSSLMKRRGRLSSASINSKVPL